MLIFFEKLNIYCVCQTYCSCILKLLCKMLDTAVVLFRWRQITSLGVYGTTYTTKDVRRSTDLVNDCGTLLCGSEPGSEVRHVHRCRNVRPSHRPATMTSTACSAVCRCRRRRVVIQLPKTSGLRRRRRRRLDLCIVAWPGRGSR